MIGVGVGIFCLGLCYCTCCELPNTRIHKRMHRAVAEESAKYSNRSPIPCRWQVKLVTVPLGEDSRTIYYVSSLDRLWMRICVCASLSVSD